MSIARDYHEDGSSNLPEIVGVALGLTIVGIIKTAGFLARPLYRARHY